MGKKYEMLMENYIKVGNGVMLYRIKALKDFNDVKKGDLGGFIQSEYNLSHNGYCWVYDDARVYENAIIRDCATVHDKANVFGRSELYEDSSARDNVLLHDAVLRDCATVRENAKISSFALLTGNAVVCGNTEIRNKCAIGIDAYIKDKREYITIGPVGVEDVLTFYISKQDEIIVSTLSYSCTVEEFYKFAKRQYNYTDEFINQCKSAINYATEYLTGCCNNKTEQVPDNEDELNNALISIRDMCRNSESCKGDCVLYDYTNYKCGITSSTPEDWKLKSDDGSISSLFK